MKCGEFVLCRWLKKLSNLITGTLETGFFKLGCLVARYPWPFIAIDLLLCVALIPGVIFLKQESRTDKLWVPQGSQAQLDKKWVDEKFPNKIRFSNAIFENNNEVLTPEIMKDMLAFDKKVKSIRKDNEYDWESICAKNGDKCWSNSLLELWNFDENVVNSLTRAKILDDINTITVSPVYNGPFTASKLLGDIKREGNRIVSAKATRMTYFIKFNATVKDGKEVDEKGESWEKSYLDIGDKGSSVPKTNLYYFSTRSFGDVGGDAISGDVRFLAAGYMIVIVFVCIVLGKFNRVEQRVWITLSGIACIGLAIGIAFGFCSYVRLFYGPLHSVLPFLLLGIGVDDMFVIIQAWESLTEEEKKKDTKEKIGCMLKHAGVSITVTSITDIVAFAVGASTIIPALRSFCLWVCVGVVFTFLFQITLFVACISFDQRRALSQRDACCCCIRYNDFTPNNCSQTSYMDLFFSKIYSKFVLSLPVKIVSIIVTSVLVGLAVWRVTKLEQDFDPFLFLPKGTYARTFIDKNNLYFPEVGINSAVYFDSEKLDYYGKFKILEDMHKKIDNDAYTSTETTDSWVKSYQEFLRATTIPDIVNRLDSNKFPKTKADFDYILFKYYIIYNGNGPGNRFIKDIKLRENTQTQIIAFRFTFTHRQLKNSAEEIKAMESIREVAESGSKELKVDVRAFENSYTSFEGNKVIQKELYRNLGLAFLCVLLMTLVLIADIWTCILVCSCVVFTLFDVGGAMELWGLTIDTVTSVQLIVAIGLAVDYSAHVGHTFMTIAGKRNERAKNTLIKIGPAVFYGGFSTFLAFILLGASNSYVFSTFFKVFFLVVIFGLFHGLVYLPVVLSWIGPSPYDSASSTGEKHKISTVSLESQPDKTNGSMQMEKEEKF